MFMMGNKSYSAVVECGGIFCKGVNGHTDIEYTS